MSNPPDREEEIFNAASRLPPGERAAFLDNACAGDAALRQRVEDLLQAGERAGNFLETPAMAQVGPEPDVSFLPAAEQPGDRIGNYKLLQKIGEGGCGVVYLAEQAEPVHRQVALKVIKLGMDTREVIARFEAERQALALMDHPNIAKVFDAGATDTGRPYFVMELVQGIKITEYCDQHNLSTGQRLDLFIQICHAIQHAHQKGIIHRDIKPSNILVATVDGAPLPKVIDFGIAKATHGKLTDQTLFTAFEQFIGTPAYMSPEQAGMSGLDVDTRSDIYSLGVLLYELLTGQTPFNARKLLEAGLDEIRRTIQEQEPAKPSTVLSTMQGGDLGAIAQQRRTEPPKLIHLVRGDLDWIVMKALEKDRARRYETAMGLAADIQRHLSNEPVMARPPSNAYRLQKMVQRNRLAVIAAGAVILSLTIGLLALGESFLRERAFRQQEQVLRQTAQTGEAAAENARRVAEAATDQTRQQTRVAQHSSYVASVGLADRFISEYRYDEALHLLDACAPEYRDWEWNRLIFLCHLGSTTFSAHSNQIWGVAFSPNSNDVATAGFDRKIRVWDAHTGQQRQIVVTFNTNAACVAYSPDGQFLAAGCYDGTGGIWETKTWRPVVRLPKHDERIFSMAYSDNGAMIATAGGAFQHSRDTAIRVSNARDGTLLGRLEGHVECVYCVRFEPGGAHLASCGQDGVRIWDLKAMKLEQHLSKFGAYTLAYTPDGRYLIYTREATIVLQNLSSGQETSLDTEDAVWSLAVSPDGRQLAAGLDDRTAIVVGLPSMQLVSTLKGHSARVVSVAFSPGGQEVATASTDGLAKVWHFAGVPDRRIIEAHSNLVESVAFSPDGRRLASTGADGHAKLWDLKSQTALQTWTAEPSPAVSDTYKLHGESMQRGQSGDNAAMSAAFSPDGSRLALGLGHTAVVWDLNLNREVSRVSEPKDLVRSVALDADGRRLLTACWQHEATLWNADNGEKLCTFGDTNAEIWSAAFRPMMNEIAVGGRIPQVTFWNTENCQFIRSIEGHQRTVSSVIYDPPGKLFASAGWDGVINVYDAITAKPFSSMKGLPWTSVAIAFSPNSQRLVSAAGRRFAAYAATPGSAAEDRPKSAGRPQELRIWEVGTGIDLLSLTGRTPPVCASFSPDGRSLASGGEDGSVTLWLTEAKTP